MNKEYQCYYTVTRKTGYGFLVRAFNEMQAIAKTKHLANIKDKYLCVYLLP